MRLAFEQPLRIYVRETLRSLATTVGCVTLLVGTDLRQSKEVLDRVVVPISQVRAIINDPEIDLVGAQGFRSELDVIDRQIAALAALCHDIE